MIVKLLTGLSIMQNCHTDWFNIQGRWSNAIWHVTILPLLTKRTETRIKDFRAEIDVNLVFLKNMSNSCTAQNNSQEIHISKKQSAEEKVTLPQVRSGQLQRPLADCHRGICSPVSVRSGPEESKSYPPLSLTSSCRTAVDTQVGKQRTSHSWG